MTPDYPHLRMASAPSIAQVRRRSVDDMTSIGGIPLDIFPIALGGNTFGWTSDAAESNAVLDAFVEAGGNFIDTADGYSAWVPGNSGGESETIIGAWLAKRSRDSIVIGTKVSQHPDFKGLSAANVAAAADASLGRLGTDHIDVYYAHFDDASVPLEETAAAFDALVTAGKVREIALSNYTGARIEEWFRIATANGFALPSALQPHYNLVHREPYEAEIAPVVAEHSLAVVPYYGLASGFLTGKYRTKADLTGSPRAGGSEQYLTEEGLGLIDRLDAIAQDHGTAIASVALAWLRSRPGVVAPIASARTLEQLPDLIASATLELTAEEVVSLDGASAGLS
jgi:aryl-alcohol dehydrogenase-like predicted oxidoreductase